MPAFATEKAQNRVFAAQKALDDALLGGQPTAEHRKNLELAVEEARRIESVARAEAVGQSAADDQQTQAAAAALAAEAAAALTAELGALTAAIPLPEPDLPQSLALALAKAEHAAEQHADAVTAHETRLEALRGRLAALQEERNEIIARRAEGRQEPDDAARVHLIEADRDGLRALIERTEGEGPGEDRSRVGEWRQSWSRAIAEERGRLLAQVAAELDHRLAQVLTLIRENGTGPWHRVGGGLDGALRALGR